jgi:hypothetical protein
MKIIASSIQRGIDTFLHAGYMSAAAWTPPPPSPESLAAVRNASPGELASSITLGDLKVAAIAAGVLVVLVLVAWLWARRVNRRFQLDLEGT